MTKFSINLAFDRYKAKHYIIVVMKSTEINDYLEGYCKLFIFQIYLIV